MAGNIFVKGRSKFHSNLGELVDVHSEYKDVKRNIKRRVPATN